MQDVFQNENLNLEVLAEMLGLSSHQLSELINTKFGCGFSRYVREKRIEVAKKILLDEPHISILAVSMMVGFKSQSNFYAGFREITGESPGHFRKSAGAG
jgi:AraC-like DNA-binding protein